jgi:phage gpG-like protein
MKFSAEVSGVMELQRRLGATQEQIHVAVKRGIDRTALAMETDAKNKLKSDGHIITNRLRASIHAELKDQEQFTYSNNQGESFDGSLNLDIGKLEAVIGTNVVYAKRIEFGFNGTDSLGRKYNQPASSFMGWAVLKQGKLLKGRIIEELNKILK